MKKILVIRFSSIGDIVLTTPVVRCVKKQLGVEIHFLTKTQFAPILNPNPYIDKVWTIKEQVDEVIPQLKKEEFDHIIDLHKNLRSIQVRSSLGVKTSTFNKLNVKKWLIVNAGIDRLPDVHIVDRYFEAATPLGVRNDGEGLDYFIPEKDEVDIRRFPDLFKRGYLVYAIGGRHEGKKMPEEKILRLLGRLSMPIILLGGPEDKPVAERLRKVDTRRILNGCGTFNLNQSASIAKQAKVVITHDTGMMHIAAAFKKNIISIWGETIPKFGMYPYMAGEQSVMIEPKNAKGRPNSKLGNKPRRKGHVMDTLDLDEVVEAVNRITG